MKTFNKLMASLTNACSYLAGIFVAIMLVFDKKYVPVVSIAGFTRSENLIINMIALVVPLALIMLLITDMVSEKKPRGFKMEFPTIYALAPIVIAAVSIIYSLKLETSREKIIVVGGSIAYVIISIVLVFCGSMVYQIYDFGKEKNEDEDED